MTITSQTSAPLFVVVGSTGTQGRSVIEALSRHPKQYRVRAVTRDASKPAAQELQTLGCEVVESDVRNRDKLRMAFQNAQIVFAMTNSDYSSIESDTERVQGKNIMDTAKAAGAKTLIWSSLPSLAAISNRKHTLKSWELKHDLAAYARVLGGMQVIEVLPGYFTSNFWRMAQPLKNRDETYTLPLPYKADTELLVIDVPADFGNYALGALDNKLVSVMAASEYTTPVKVVEALSRVSGKTIKFKELSDTQYYSMLLSTGLGEYFARAMMNMAAALRDWKSMGAPGPTPQDILSSPARTFEESAIANADEIRQVFT